MQAARRDSKAAVRRTQPRTVAAIQCRFGPGLATAHVVDQGPGL